MEPVLEDITQVGRKRLAKYDAIIAQAAGQTGLNANLLRAALLPETLNYSKIDPDTAISVAGAIGPAQLMPNTAAQYGVDPFIPEENILGGAKHLKYLMDRYGGDAVKSIAAYNAGEGKVDETIGRYGDDWVNNLPDETQKHLPKVASFLEQLEKEQTQTDTSQVEAVPDTSPKSISYHENSKIPYFRNRYPELNDLSDNDLIGGFHQKYAPDTDAKEFESFFTSMFAPPKEGESFFPFAWRALKRGTVGTAEGIASAIEWTTGKKLFAPGYFKVRQEELAPPEEIQQSISEHPELFFDWRWWTEGIVSSAPFTLLSLVPTGGASVVAGISARAAGIAAPMVINFARIAGGALGGGLFESYVEAGMAHNQSLSEGNDEQTASNAANETFKGNIVLNSIINAYQVGLVFRNMGVPITKDLVKRGLGQVVAQYGKTGVAEGIQEGLQQVISNSALGRPWNEGLYESALIGGVSGVGFGVGLDIMTSAHRYTPSVIEEMKEGIAEEVEKAMVQEKDTTGRVVLVDEDTLEKIDSLVGKIFSGEKDFSEEELQLQKNYPVYIEDALNRLKAGEQTEKTGVEKAKKKKKKQKKLVSDAVDNLDPVTTGAEIGSLIKQLTDDGSNIESLNAVNDFIAEAKKDGLDDKAILKQLIEVNEATMEKATQEIEQVIEENKVRPGVEETLTPAEQKMQELGAESIIKVKEKLTDEKDIQDWDRLQQKLITDGVLKGEDFLRHDFLIRKAMGETKVEETEQDPDVEDALKYSIPKSAREDFIKKLGGPQVSTQYGELGKISDADLVRYAKEKGIFETAPKSEAPVSRGGSMEGRGPANVEAVKQAESKLDAEQKVKAIESVLSEEEKPYVRQFLRFAAQANNQSLYEYINQRATEARALPIGEKERTLGIKGSAIYGNERRILTLYKGKADLSTFVEEMFHLSEDFFSEAQRKPLEEWIGKPRVEWKAEESEKAAGAWIDYWESGKAPNKELQTFFDKIKEFFTNIYKYLRDEGIQLTNIPPEVREVFDSLIDRESRVKLESKGQREFLTQYGESPLGGQKVIGHIQDQTLEKATFIADKLKNYGYESFVYEHPLQKVSGGQVITNTVGDVFYHLPNDSKRVAKPLEYGIRLVRGEITQRQYGGYLKALGFSFDARNNLVKKWEGRVTTVKRGRPKVADIQRESVIPKELSEGGVKHTIKHPMTLDEQTVKELDKSNEELQKTVDELRVKGDNETADKLETVLEDIRNPLREVNVEKDSNVNLEADAKAIQAIEDFNALSLVLRETRDPAIRAELRKKYDEQSKVKVPQQVRDVIESDPDFGSLDQTPPLSETQRAKMYEELSLSKEDGDRLNDEDIDSMIENKGFSEDSVILFQTVQRRIPVKTYFQLERKGKEIIDTKLPREQVKAFENTLHAANLSQEEIHEVMTKAGQLVAMPQTLARWNSHWFGRIFRLGDDLVRIKNRIVTEISNDKRLVDFRSANQDTQKEVFKYLRMGSNYGANTLEGVLGRPIPPWKNSNSGYKKNIAQQFKEKKITQEQRDSARENNNRLRNEWFKADKEWKAKAQSVGKVFSESELKSLGASDEVTQHYFNFREVIDEVIDYWKKAAIAAGMSPVNVQATFGQKGYFPQDRSRGKWSLMVKDPTSPTGYSYQRYTDFEEAKLDRDNMIKEGRIDPSDEKQSVHRTKDLFRRYAPYISVSQLSDIMAESGFNLSEIEEKLTTTELSPATREYLEGQKDMYEKVLKEVKSRTYAGARTIHRNYTSFVSISPATLNQVFDDFVYKTANRYARSLSQPLLEGLIREIPQEGNPVMWKIYARDYVDLLFKPNQFMKNKFFDTIRQFGYLYSLAFNVSNAIVNMSQPLIQTVPFLKEWGLHTFTVLPKATSITLDYVFRKGSVSNSHSKEFPGLLSALEQLRYEHVIAPIQQEEIADFIKGRTPKEKLARSLSILQIKSEEFNRTLSATMGYMQKERLAELAKGNRQFSEKLAEIAGVNQRDLELLATQVEPEKRADAYQSLTKDFENRLFEGKLDRLDIEKLGIAFAAETSNTTQNIYGTHNYPKFITSAGMLASPLRSGFLFKGFINNYVGFLVTSLKNEAERRGTMWSLVTPTVYKAYLFGPLLLLAGLSGLPFADDIKEALKSLGLGDLDDETRKIIGDEDWADFILKGIPAALPQNLAMDMSRRFGVGNVLPKGLPRAMIEFNKDELFKAVEDILGGAPIGIISRIPEGLKNLKNGELTVGMRQILPVFAGNLVRAIWEYPEYGALSSQGNQIVAPEEMSTTQVTLSALGFKPLPVGKAEDFQSLMRYQQEERKDIVSEFNEKLANAIAAQDDAEVQDIIKDVILHNSKAKTSELYSPQQNLPAIRRRVLLKLTRHAQLKYSPKLLRPEYLRAQEEFTNE